MPSNITTGQKLQGLKGLTQQQIDEANKIAEEAYYLNRAFANQSRRVTSTPGNTTVPYEKTSPMYNWGNSKYDSPILNTPLSEGDIQDMRHDNQSWYDTLANGVGKMLGTAGTTFVSSLVGLPYGLIQAGTQQRWSALWDNDVTNGLAKVDEWLEQNMTNYKSQKQQEAPWYSADNLLSMNFWADDVIKNMGFTLGAAASMTVGSGSLGLLSKAFNLTNKIGAGTKMTGNAISALFSATGEGMIEANQGVRERNKLYLQELDDTFAPQREAIKQQKQMINDEYVANRGKSFVRGADGQMYDSAYVNYMNQMDELQKQEKEIENKYNAGKQQIEESGLAMGNSILLGNQILLTAGNLIQFGKAMTKSFDKARHAAEVSSKSAKPFGVTAERVGKNLSDGYEIKGKNFARALALSKGALTEGSEEMNQQWIQSGSGAYYNRRDINDYWKSKLDPESIKDTEQSIYTLGNAISQGFGDSWGSGEQWEQFFIGALTGFTGSYAPTKLFNQDKSKAKWNPTRYGDWSGGAYNEFKDFNKEYNQYSENIDDLNKILKSNDFDGRLKSMIGHTYTEGLKRDAVNNNSKREYKDAEDKQMVHDIQSFLRAGKLDDLRAIYDEMSGNFSDEDIDSIIKSTTKEISAEEDKSNFDRNKDIEIAVLQQKSDEAKDKIQDIFNTAEKYESENEKKAYLDNMSKEIENYYIDINKINADIEKLNAEKSEYVGKKYYEGTFVDKDGNRNKEDSNDAIREGIKHNTDELKRKLDSYLDSIDAVNNATGGKLTKDQEDNLAYLHNLGKESIVRMNKIMANVRKQLPSKFLLKTSSTPEELTRLYGTSDLAFNKDENTKKGYVEVDTATMTDEAFANFFQTTILRGGNISEQLAETEEEKVVREQEEKDLSAEEKKKRAIERNKKQWESKRKQMVDDANEQYNENYSAIINHFFNEFKKNGTTSVSEMREAFNKFSEDISDSYVLYDQAGKYHSTLMEYLTNPSLVDKDKEKAEKNADNDKQKKGFEKFKGKSASDINKEVENPDSNISFDDLSEFANIDLDDITGDDVDEGIKEAQKNAQEASKIQQKKASIIKHINDDDSISQEAKDIAINKVSNASLEIDSAEDLNAASIEDAPITLSDDDNPFIDYDDLLEQVNGIIDASLDAYEVDEDMRNKMPKLAETSVSIDDNGETGKDPVSKTKPIVNTPDVSTPSKAEDAPIPNNPLTQDAYDNIVVTYKEERPSSPEPFRSCTTRFKYGNSYGTYHEIVAKERYGENSKEYKRAKAIYEYLNSEEIRAFDRLDDASKTRIKKDDIIHFAVHNISQEVFGKSYNELTEEEKPYALVILTMNENGEILGDLPLLQMETSTAQNSDKGKLLKNLQEKIFNAYNNKNTTEDVIVDNLEKDGYDNLNLAYKNGSPIISQVNQVMHGVIPFTKKGETNTLNDVAGNPNNLVLGVRINNAVIAKKKGDKNEDKNIYMPRVGNPGQPYFLLPTASGESYAIPFYMPVFNTEKHKNTELYKYLGNAFASIIQTKPKSKSEIELYGRNVDAIEGLLQIKKQKDKNLIEEKDGKYIVHLKELTNDNTFDIEVNKTGEDTTSIGNDVISILNEISSRNIPINVSLNFLNNTIEVGTTSTKRKASYNSIIGEIADINLPKNTTHTINCWFTIKLTTETGIVKQKRTTPAKNGIHREIIAGEEVDVNYDDYSATFVNTENPNATLVEAVNEFLAREKAKKFPGKESVQINVDGRTVTYKVNKDGNVSKVNQKKEEPKKEMLTENVETFEFADISDVETPTEGSVDFSGNTEPKKTERKSLEDVEKTMVEQKIINKDTEDSWKAIENSLKERFINGEINLKLSFGTKNFIVSFSNTEGLIKALSETKIGAKRKGLKIEEAPKAMEKEGKVTARENEREMRKWLAKNLPMLSSEERTIFIDNIIRHGNNAPKVWGNYRNGVIEINNNAPMGTVYHEAFHYVMDMILGNDERTNILNIARNEYGQTLTNLELEERLANDFRRYSLDANATGIIGTIRKWFRKIKDRINKYERISDTTINQLFWKINNGQFANQSIAKESFEKNQQRILREIRNIRKEKLSWNNLNNDTRENLIDSGLSEAVYNEMSLEEKEQWLKCRG